MLALSFLPSVDKHLIFFFLYLFIFIIQFYKDIEYI